MSYNIFYKNNQTVKWSQIFVSLTQLCSLMNPIKALDLSHIISKGAIQIISRCEALFHHSLWTEFSYILTCLSSRFESVHYFKATNELQTSDKRWSKRSFSLLILYFSSLNKLRYPCCLIKEL